MGRCERVPPFHGARAFLKGDIFSECRLSSGWSLSDREIKSLFFLQENEWSRRYNQRPGNHPNFEKKRSRSEKAILGATLGIPGHSRSNSRNGSHDLIYVKTLFSEQLSERLSELVGRPKFSPNSRSVFFKIGVVPEHQIQGDKSASQSSRRRKTLEHYCPWISGPLCVS